MDHATRIGARGPLGIDPFMMRLTTVLDELAKNMARIGRGMDPSAHAATVPSTRREPP